MRSAALPRFSSKIPGFILFSILSLFREKRTFWESRGGAAAPAFPKGGEFLHGRFDFG